MTVRQYYGIYIDRAVLHEYGVSISDMGERAVRYVDYVGGIVIIAEQDYILIFVGGIVCDSNAVFE